MMGSLISFLVPCCRHRYNKLDEHDTFTNINILEPLLLSNNDWDCRVMEPLISQEKRQDNLLEPLDSTPLLYVARTGGGYTTRVFI